MNIDKHSVPNKDFRKLIAHYSQFVVERRKKHIKIVNPKTKDFVITSCSVSDWRGLRNLHHDLERLASGHGYLAMKQN